MTGHYDLIVVGGGTMGLSTAYAAIQKGWSVLVVEQYQTPHDAGSHSGDSRIYRKAYFEHPDYVPLLEECYKLWSEWERAFSERLLHETGLLYMGKANSSVLNGVERSSELFDIALSMAPLVDIAHFVSFEKAWLEPHAGFVRVGQVLPLLKGSIVSSGARVLDNTKVISWEMNHNNVQVYSEQGSFSADYLVITAGAYINNLLNVDLGINITQQELFWFRPENISEFMEYRFPCWNMEVEDTGGIYYGFPSTDNETIKIAHHVAMNDVEPGRKNDSQEYWKEDILEFTSTYFPRAGTDIVRQQSCYYANSEDEDFIIDFLEGSKRRIAFATGFSGHGFKFCPVIGRILVDMISTKKYDQKARFLNLSRFSS